MFFVHCMKTSNEQPIIKPFTMKEMLNKHIAMMMDWTKLK
jgi:hypothetical protein